MASISKITPCMWFDNQTKEAARFYTSVLNSKVTTVSRDGEDVHDVRDGAVVRAERAMTAMLRMKDLYIAELQRAI